MTSLYVNHNIKNLQPNEVAIVQYDSRPLRDYWFTSALWNYYYTQHHGHQFIYYNLEKECHYQEYKLADAWCKVKAMLQADEEYPDVKVFIYMDSDAVISKRYANSSLITLISIMANKLQWNPTEKPMVFNQDGPCWWCNLILKVGYTMCLNAGTVVWYRHEYSHEILTNWWHSTMESYADNPLKRKFRTNWPWEQDRQMAIYHRSPQHIQIASNPNSSMLSIESINSGVDNGMSKSKSKNENEDEEQWCLSHLPGYHCFIAHYCANPSSKQRLRVLYRHPGLDETIFLNTNQLPFQIHELQFK